jgi:hypothetical protein
VALPNGNRLQAVTIQNRGVQLWGTIGDLEYQQTQVLRQRREDTSEKLRLLVHGEPGQQVIRQSAPLHTRADQPAQAVKDVAQGIAALWSMFGHQGQVRLNERHSSSLGLGVSGYALGLPPVGSKGITGSRERERR